MCASLLTSSKDEMSKNISQEPFVRIPRNHFSWKLKPNARLVVQELMRLTQHTEKKVTFNGRSFDLKAGECVTTAKVLAGLTRLKQTQVEGAIRRGRKCGHFAAETLTGGTVFTVAGLGTYSFSESDLLTKRGRNAEVNPNLEQEEENKKKNKKNKQLATDNSVIQISAFHTTQTTRPTTSLIDRVQVEDCLNYFAERTKQVIRVKAKGNQEKLVKLIKAHKATPEEIKLVIDHKCHEWLGCEKMERHLKLVTVFSPGKWDGYLDAALTWQEKKKVAVQARAQPDWDAGFIPKLVQP